MDATPDQVALRVNEALAAELRAAKAILNITQQHLSDQSGVPMRTLTRILAGDRDIDVKQLASLAGPLGVPADELVARATRRARNLAAVGALPEDAVKTRFATAANQSSEDDPTNDDEPV